jgi:hypothetical protein
VYKPIRTPEETIDATERFWVGIRKIRNKIIERVVDMSIGSASSQAKTVNIFL